MKPYSLLSRIYDRGWADFSRRYAVFLEELFELRGISADAILDLACGTGTLAFEMARRGHCVHGIDISPEMIERARDKSAGMERVSFAVGDMTRFRTNRLYDVVTCTFDSINYLIRPAQIMSVLRRTYGCMRPSGLLVFDSNTTQLYLNYQQETNKNELDGISFTQSCRFNPAKNIAKTTFEFSDGTIEIHRQRPYEYKDLGPMLSRAGFQVIHLFSWFNRSPYTSKTEKLFCVAQKSTI